MDGISLPTHQQLLVFPCSAQSDFQSQINMYVSIDSSCSVPNWADFHQIFNLCIISSRNYLFILCLYCMVLISSLRGLVPFSFLLVTEYGKTFIFAFFLKGQEGFIYQSDESGHEQNRRSSYMGLLCSVSLKIRPLDCSRAYRCIILYGNVQAVWSEGGVG